MENFLNQNGFGTNCAVGQAHQNIGGQNDVSFVLVLSHHTGQTTIALQAKYIICNWIQLAYFESRWWRQKQYCGSV